MQGPRQRGRDVGAELVELQADYQSWLDGLAERLPDTPKGPGSNRTENPCKPALIAAAHSA